MTLEKPNVNFVFSDSLPEVVADYDVVMAYEFFLGRPPENAAVIDSHKMRRFDNLIKTFTNSSEFILSTVEPVRRATPIQRMDHTKGPARNHVSWLLEHMVLNQDDAVLLYGAASWEEFFRLFLALGRAAGMTPDPQQAEAPAPAPAPAATAIPAPPPPGAAADGPDAERDAAVEARLAQIESLVADIRTLLQPGRAEAPAIIPARPPPPAAHRTAPP